MADFFDISETMTTALLGQSENVSARASGKAQAALELGILASIGTTDRTLSIPNAAADVTYGARGIVERIVKLEGDDAYYDSGEMVSLVKRGQVWVTVEDAVTDGTQAFVRITAKATPLANEALGRFRSDADGTDSGVATGMTNAVFRTTQATAGGLALVEINLP